MLLRFRVLPLVFVISLLSGCGLASKAFIPRETNYFNPEMTPSLRCRRIQWLSSCSRLLSTRRRPAAIIWVNGSRYAG